MEDTLLTMFQTYLGGEYDNSMEAVVRLCINRAMASFKAYMNYPSDYVEKGNDAEDMQKHIYCLFDLAFYFWNLQGVEFQTEHTENSVKRTYNTEATIYATHGIVPFVKVMD